MRARKGIYAAALTPITHGEPDIGKLVGYCRYLLENGCDGVAPAGTTGEGNSLPSTFRLAAPEAFAAAGFAGDQVIFGTGACAADDSVALTRAAVEAGFPNVLVLPPFYFKNPSDDGLYAYYSRLIERVGSDRLRVYFYHFPQMSMVPISLDLARRMKAEFGPIIAGLKDSSGDFATSKMFATSITDFDVFPSNEGALLEAIDVGCAGVISATTNASSAIAQRTLQAKGAEGVALQESLRSIRTTIQNYPLSPALKEIVAWRTGDRSWTEVLPPQLPLTSEQASTLRAALDKLNLGEGYSFAA